MLDKLDLCKLTPLHRRRCWGWATACGMSCVVVFRDPFAKSLTSIYRNSNAFKYIHVPKCMNYCKLGELWHQLQDSNSAISPKNEGPKWTQYTVVSVDCLRILLQNGCPRSTLLIPPCSLTRRWVTPNWYPWLGGEQKYLSVSELCNIVGHVPGSVRIVTKNSQTQSAEETERLERLGDLCRPHWYSLILDDCSWNTRRVKAWCWSTIRIERLCEYESKMRSKGDEFLGF